MAPTVPRPGVVLVRVLGEIDVLTAGRLEQVLGKAVTEAAHGAHRGGAGDGRGPRSAGEQAAEVPQVVCDLDGVEFLGARGLDVFARIAEAAADGRVELVVVATRRVVQRAFELTALDRTVALRTARPIEGRTPCLADTVG